MSILHALEKHITLSKEEGNYFLSLLNTHVLKQGEFIEKAGKITEDFIYVKSGCLMTYYTNEQAQEHVIQFAMPNWWTGDLNSFTKQVISAYSTRALADSEVLLIKKKDLDGLLERFPVFEKYFRVIFQNSLITHQNRIVQNIAATAEERYLDFQKKYPSLEQYVPLKYIASYLGITPEFLSKIRRRLMER
jgi:CRP-like cAMP-binding protein